VADGSYTYAVTAVRNSWTAASTRSNAVAVTNLSVTVNQASSQADPTNTASVAFTAVFSESVTGLSSSEIRVSGLTSSGTVTVSVAADAAQNPHGVGNAASTSTDNTVTFDVTSPTAAVPGLTAVVTYGAAPVYVSNETVTLTDVAADADSGVQSVSYFSCAGGSGSCTSANGTLIGASTTAAGNYPVSSSTPLASPDGVYQVIAVVADKAGNVMTSAPLQVAVDTSNPTVSAPLVNGNA
jgi:hypothetical protein